jgi:hypothetical protein
VDADATIASGAAALTLALGPGSDSTLPALSDNALTGARCLLRAHMTLGRLQQLLTPGLSGHASALRADGVQVLEDGQIVRYRLDADGASWRTGGSDDDFRDKVLPPDASFAVQARRAPQLWRHAGAVRTNPFRKNLARGLQSFATGFPQDLSPVQIGAFVDAAAPAGSGWTGRNAFLFADQIQLVLGEPRPWELFYLRSDGFTWRSLSDPTNVAESKVLGATSLILVRRINPDPTYRVPVPFAP